MKKLMLFIALCLCVTSIPVMATHSLSTEETIGTKYVHISTFDARLTINSSGKATVVAAASGSSSVAKTVVEAELMRYKNGSWSEYKSWSDTNYDDYASVVTTYYVPSGYNYKLVAKVYVYDKYGNKLDSLTETTTSVYY